MGERGGRKRATNGAVVRVLPRGSNAAPFVLVHGLMNVIETITEHNRAFASEHFDAKLKIIPSLKTMIIGCVDPRVDPNDVLGLSLGDAAIIRNVGGRVTPDLIATLKMLRIVAKAGGGDLGTGWSFIVLHHTDCGITRLHGAPDMLAGYFGVPEAALADLAIDDPRRSVVRDIAALAAEPAIASGILVTGMVYDVATGHVEVTVPTAPLRT